MSELSDRVRSGDARAIARAISLIEDDTSEGAALRSEVSGRPGHAYETPGR